MPKNKLFATLDVTNHGAKLPCNMSVNFLDTVSLLLLVVIISAARFGDLSPFGLLFQPFGDQYFALATWEFGNFLGYFTKLTQNRFKTGLEPV